MEGFIRFPNGRLLERKELMNKIKQVAPFRNVGYSFNFTWVTPFNRQGQFTQADTTYVCKSCVIFINFLILVLLKGVWAEASNLNLLVLNGPEY